MKRIAITILLQMCFGYISAQNTFYRLYDNPYSNTPNDIFELDGNYFVCGEFSYYGGGGSDAFLMKVNSRGETMWAKVIDHAYRESYNSILNVGDGFIAGGSKIVDSKNHNVLSKFDYEGNEIWNKTIGDTGTLAYDNIINELTYSEGIVLIGTSGYDTTSMTTVGELYKVDLDGNVLWKRKYGVDGEEPTSERIYQIQELTNGYLLYMYSESLELVSFPYVVKVDKSGNEIWRKQLRHYNSELSDTDTIIDFKSFSVYKKDHVLVHYTRRNDINYTSSNIFIEFDENGNELEFKEFEQGVMTVYSELFTNADDEIFLIGQQDYDTVGTFYSELFATKFDRDKQLIWQKHFGGKDTNETQVSAILTKDGGVLIGGTILNTAMPPYGFNTVLVKTDCLGSLDWNYNACVYPSQVETVLIFPNPFTQRLTIHLQTLHTPNEILIQIFDAKGRLLNELKYLNTRVLTIDGSEYAAGLYFVRVFIDGQIIESQRIVKIGSK